MASRNLYISPFSELYSMPDEAQPLERCPKSTETSILIYEDAGINASHA